MEKKCLSCGNMFEILPGKEWAKICLPCWKKEKGIPDRQFTRKIKAPLSETINSNIEVETLKSSLTHASTIIVGLKQHIRILENILSDREYELQELRNKSDSSELDGIVKSLIRLCHPDRHHNSEVSNEITAKLISYKKRKNL